jgi:hypothetical protein
MSITTKRREEIKDVQKRINDAITWIKNKEAELQTIVDLVSTVPSHAREQMSRSASSSTKKKGKGETVGIDEAVARYERMMAEMRDAIANKKLVLERLEKEKRELKEYEQGT